MGDDDSTSKAARIGLEILGWLLLAAGVAALVLPGPGLLLLALGLWVLAKNYRWADRLLDPVKRAAYRGASESVTSWPRIILSTLLALGLIALGIYWGVRPPALGWSMKNFRYGDMTLEEVYKDRHLKEGPRRSE